MNRTTVRRAGLVAAQCLRGAVAGLLAVVVLHWGHILALGNFREVVPGQVYRSGQLSAGRLEKELRRYGIRTVVNLRGPCPSAVWYQADVAAAAAVGASLEDLAFSASRLPSMASVRQMVEVLERSEYPILIHCQQGADRTGLAVVMYFLLRTEVPYEEARRHLGLATGHVAAGRTARVDRFFELYEEWLAAAGVGHAPARFREWAMEHYCPDLGRARLEWRSMASGVGTVRAHNTSLRPWRLTPGPTGGVVLKWALRDGKGRVVQTGRTGLFDAVVAPGEYIDLSVPVGPLPAGRYELALDLADGEHATFLQLGNELYTVELRVP